ncbi:WAT1-related protein At5g07050-like [Zingiber officinale]|uniref:WAT1-related protein At5g07050-like n=1 Tax=Zingiber officinale TaxID=94328 RepID=UPI001C4ACA04|nr:WAT1-related protein At5g07050-like [Zingiber officinale]
MASVKACAPYFYMIVSQFVYVGSSILGKLALGQGLSVLVFVVYRHLIAMLILAPLAYVLERFKEHQNVYYVGLHLISPTVASALGNVIPAFTFLLAIVLRMEKLNLKIVRGRARLARTIFCITGALIFTFWKGHLLGAFVTSPMIQLHFETPEKGNACLKGSALMLFGYFACSVSLVLQASICEIYPAKLTMNAVMCFFVALQSSALSLIFKRNASSWRMFPLFTHVILCIVFVWVLNGLLSRDNQKEALSIPIGIIPAV